MDDLQVGDTIVIIEAPTLPDHYQKYIGKEFIVKKIVGNHDAEVRTGAGTKLDFISGEFEVVPKSNYNKHKSKLNI